MYQFCLHRCLLEVAANNKRGLDVSSAGINNNRCTIGFLFRKQCSSSCAQENQETTEEIEGQVFW